MSVDITAKSGPVMDVTNVGWRFVLEFARRCEWRPAGTLPPMEYTEADGTWDGSYDPAMGQSVSDVDAASLGESIGKGLESARLNDLLSQVTESLTEHAASFGYKDGPAAKVTEKTIDMLRQVAELARHSGGFRIA